MTDDDVDYRLRIGRFHLVHRGVPALASITTNLGRWMAAVLAGGDGAALGHMAAAQLYRLRGGFRVPVDVVVPRARRPRRGIRFHRVVLPADELTVVEGIPVTTVPRTILDCAAGATAREVERMLNEAEVLRLHDQLSLLDLLHRHPTRAGSVNVRRALEKRSEGATVTKRELEELFIPFLDGIGVRRPEVNAVVHAGGRTFEVDCVWRAERVVVELDSRQFHDAAEAFELDRLRDRALVTAGWAVLRVTWRQLHSGRDALARDLTALLVARRAAA